MALEDILAQAASSSLPQQGGGMNVGNMTTFGPAPLVQPPPPVRFQPPQIQKPQAGNEFQTVSGNKRATKQSALSGIAQMVKAGSDYVTAKKTRTLQMNIERLMEAQQGLQEAQAALQQNPNDPKAKAAVEQNTGIINDITKDPKVNKQLQKAFNIDLFGNGKNKQENQALIEATKKFQEKQAQGDKTALNPVAQRLMQSQPMRQQIDPALQQRAMMIKAGLVPNANTILKETEANNRAIVNAKSQEERSKAIEEAAKTRAKASNQHDQALIDMNNAKILGQAAMEEIKFKASKYRADATVKAAELRLKAADEHYKGNSYIKILGDQGKLLSKQLKDLQTADKAAQAELDKKGSSLFGHKFGAATDADSNRLRKQLIENQLKEKTLTDKLGQLNETYDSMTGFKEEETPEEVNVSDEEVPE